MENSQETIGHRTAADDYWSMAQYSALGTIFLLCPTHPFSVPFLPFFAAFAPHSRGSGIKRGQGERIKSKGEGSDAASVSAHQGVFNCTHTHTQTCLVNGTRGNDATRAWLIKGLQTNRHFPDIFASRSCDRSTWIFFLNFDTVIQISFTNQQKTPINYRAAIYYNVY